MRIFFVETGGGVGGSVISLYYLVKGLLPRDVQPVVSFPAPHAWSSRFEELGAQVRHERATAVNPGVIMGDTNAAPKPVPARTARPDRPWTRSEAWKTLHFYRTHWRDHARSRDRWTRVIRDVAPDLVYTNNDLPLNFDVAEAADGVGLPVVCHLRGFQPIRRPHRAFASHMKAGIAISEVVRRHYLDAGFEPGLIQRVYNGIEMADYPWREPRINVPADGGRLLFVGRLTGWKGAPVLLDAMASLTPRRPALELTVLGDGPARNEWEQEVNLRGLSDRVRFTGFTSQVVPALHEADLLVHASIEPEPFGRVLIEGMAAGVPVVASDLGATREIIEDRVSGRLVPAGDPQSLAAAIDEILATGDGRRTLSLAARKRVEENFTVDTMAGGVAAIIDRVMGRGAAGFPAPSLKVAR